MRILKFLLKSGLIILGTLVIGALLGREVLLLMGVNQVKSSLTTLRRTELNGDYYQQCIRKGASPIDGELFALLQLRFDSDNHYLLEVLCNQYSFDPIVLKEETLPIFVTKVAGDSGLIWGDDLSAVRLEIFGRQTAVGVKNRKIIRLDHGQALGIAPLTTCQGFGFECCQLESELGQGRQLEEARDCPRTCYESCQARPVLLAFRTDPAVVSYGEPLEIRSGQTVTFSYVLDPGQAEAVKTIIDYGDGQQEEMLAVEAQVSHTYQCQQTACEYQVKLMAENEFGVETADLPINNLRIMVK